MLEFYFFFLIESRSLRRAVIVNLSVQHTNNLVRAKAGFKAMFSLSLTHKFGLKLASFLAIAGRLPFLPFVVSFACRKERKFVAEYEGIIKSSPSTKFRLAPLRSFDPTKPFMLEGLAKLGVRGWWKKADVEQKPNRLARYLPTVYLSGGTKNIFIMDIKHMRHFEFRVRARAREISWSVMSESIKYS